MLAALTANSRFIGDGTEFEFTIHMKLYYIIWSPHMDETSWAATTLVALNWLISNATTCKNLKSGLKPWWIIHQVLCA